MIDSWCFTSTEARWPIRDGDRVGRGRPSEGSTAETARKRPERPWTAARTMEVLRRCPLAIAQRLVHCAIAVSTAVLGQSHKDNVRCTAVDQQLGQLPTHDLFWAKLRVQLHLPPLRSLDLLISPGTRVLLLLLISFCRAYFQRLGQHWSMRFIVTQKPDTIRAHGFEVVGQPRNEIDSSY